MSNSADRLKKMNIEYLSSKMAKLKLFETLTGS